MSAVLTTRRGTSLVVVLAGLIVGAAIVAPVSADLSDIGFGMGDCGWVWSAPFGGDSVLEPLGGRCGTARLQRVGWLLVVGVLALVVLAVTRQRGRVGVIEARVDPQSARSEVTIVVLAHVAPLLGVAIILPAIFFVATRQSPRLAVAAARAFDTQLLLVASAAAALAFRVVTGGSGPGYALSMLVIPSALGTWFAVAVNSWWWAWRGTPWRSGWTPLLVLLTSSPQARKGER